MAFVLSIWLVCIATCDLRHRRVPNLLVLAGVCTAVVALVGGWQPLGVDWRTAVMTAATAFAVLLGFYAVGLMGAADVKFAAALGLWIGPWPLLWVWVGASLLAGVHALALLVWRSRTGLPRTRKREIPYAAHMAVMTMGWLAWQHHMS
ncbi:prepilin peptidase [Xenophilus sp. Marseille-Q4582]|uniref:A24 family peptidase n=1 Tax=Xenophilus sp. Marseille-Q4582 TaxID=2866600 RepID=UPI001CE46F89|nr:A24 family peptidase [Xenophilus sp. Marseille-Q4582]